MNNIDKFLTLFSDFEMVVAEKQETGVQQVQSNSKSTISVGQTKTELKKVLKHLVAEYNRAKKSYKLNKISRQELFDFEWRLFEIQEEIKKLDEGAESL